MPTSFCVTPHRRSGWLGPDAAFGDAGDWPPAETLRIAVEGEYPPFNRVDKKGKLSGFDVDIANALVQGDRRVLQADPSSHGTG